MRNAVIEAVKRKFVVSLSKLYHLSFRNKILRLHSTCCLLIQTSSVGKFYFFNSKVTDDFFTLLFLTFFANFVLDFNPICKGAVVWAVVASDAIRFQSSVGSHFTVISFVPFSEAPFSGNGNFLAPGKLEFRTTQSLDYVVLVLLLCTNRDNYLKN